MNTHKQETRITQNLFRISLKLWCTQLKMHKMLSQASLSSKLESKDCSSAVCIFFLSLPPSSNWFSLRFCMSFYVVCRGCTKFMAQALSKLYRI